MQNVAGLYPDLAWIDSDDHYTEATEEHRQCIHPGFKTHGQSQPKYHILYKMATCHRNFLTIPISAKGSIKHNNITQTSLVSVSTNVGSNITETNKLKDG